MRRVPRVLREESRTKRRDQGPREVKLNLLRLNAIGMFP